jgi:sugar lactone lactonase YvrE
MNRIASFALALFGAAAAASAGQTRNWTQGDFSDFDKAVIRNLSVRSDGVLTLAPQSRELLDTSSPYLWALARDSKGNLYAGGGTGAKLHRIGPDGKHKVIAELEGLEIHALAIDKQDRVYAATSPDGKVYRIAGSGKPEVFFDPKAKYIWALVFNPSGDLFVATGDKGEVYRVTPDGKGSVFFKSEETHVRSMAADSAGGLIVGTEPRGLVIRVSPSGEGFVLYQMTKKEVTAVAVAKDGAVYAAAVGVKQATPSAPAGPSAPPQIAITAQSAQSGAAQTAVRVAAPPPPTLAPGAQTLAGGSEVYRIEPSGNPRRVWAHPQEIVYSIAIDPAGRVLLGSGNKGMVYRVDSPSRYTALLNFSSTQITAFASAPDGRVFAAAGNVGKVYEIGAAPEKEGAIESDVFDSGVFSSWGRLVFDAKLKGGKLAISTRSGNHDQPQKNWSPWSGAITAEKGERVQSPAARFLQWRATLSASPSGASPEVYSVDVAYLPKNLEPRVDQVEVAAVNYRFPAPSSGSSSTPTLSLPPMGKRSSSSSTSLTLDSTSSPTLTYAHGVVSARWLASDPNGDSLLYTVEIRGEQETQWKPLKQKVREKYASFDATAFPDGEYRLRVTATDSPSNPPAEALSAAAESDPFLIDNTPPRVTNLSVARNGGRLEITWRAADALNNVANAEYSLDGGDWTVAAPVGGLSDSLELDYKLVIENVAPGEHTIAVRVEDEYDNSATEKVVVK